jgi:glycosyltransferase involved in cell wall biosynthesis
MASTTVFGPAGSPDTADSTMQVMRPRVSVIIPCYNLGCYLREAVDSVRAQTMRTFEVIIVNDGSSEVETLDVLRTLEQEGARVLHTPNQGLAAARNYGTSHARGEFILPLDADDLIAPTYLEQAVAVLDINPTVGIVCGQVELFGEASGIWPQPEYSEEAMLFENLIVASSVFRRADWKRVGGYRISMLYGWEDWDLWLSLIAAGRAVVRLPEVVFFYRIRSNSMTSRMAFWHKFWMFFKLVQHHPFLYLKNFRGVIRRCLKPRRRLIASPR